MNKARQQALHWTMSVHATSTPWFLPTFDTIAQRQWLRGYFDFLDKTYGHADFAGVADANQQTPMALASIFVPGRYAVKEVDERAINNPDFEELEDLLIQFDANEKPLGVAGKLVIVGEPGSGKTSLVRVLASACGRSSHNYINTRFGRRPVIPFILRELDLAAVRTTDDLLNLWRARVHKISGEDLVEMDHLLSYLTHGWAIVAFDGVDEIGVKQQRRLRRLVFAFAARFPKVAMLVTGRPVGFERVPYVAPPPRLWHAIQRREGWTERLPVPQLLQRRLLPFNDEQIAGYIKRWYVARYPENKARQEDETRLLVDSLANYPGLQQIKRRPIYLAILTYVHDVKGKLPNSLVLAYEGMVEAYLDVLDAAKRLKRDNEFFEREDRWRVLERLAHDLHHQLIGNKTDPDQPFSIQLQKSDFITWLTQWITEEEDCPLALKTAQIPHLLAYYVARSGLLVEPEEGVLQFSHLSFQEFLVGSWVYREMGNHTTDLVDFIKQEVLDPLDKNPAWFPVALSYFGLQSRRQGGKFQELLLKDTWLKSGAIKIQRNRFAHLHRLLKEGEPTFSDAFKATMWLYYWEHAVADYNFDWLASYYDCANNWDVWGDKTRARMETRWLSLPAQEGSRQELILFSAMPLVWIKRQWKALPRERLLAWQNSARASTKIKLALDLHSLTDEVFNIIEPLFLVRECLLFLDIYNPPVTTLRILNNTNLKSLYINIYWACNIFNNLLTWDQVRARDRDLARDMVRDLDLDLAWAPALVRARALDRTLALALARARARDQAQARDQARDLALARALDLDRDLDLDLDLDLARALDLALARDQSTIRIILLHLNTQAYAASTPLYYATPHQALAALEALGEKDAEFKTLFKEEWFPYQHLQHLAKTPYSPEPLEAMSHRVYRLLRHRLQQIGEKTDDLPAYLSLQPGDHFRRWHREEEAVAYLAALKDAGWDVEKEPWPPVDADRLITNPPNL